MATTFSSQAENPGSDVLSPPPEEKILPEREIKYEEEVSPEWKQNWDFARELLRDEKYSEAIVQYEILFSLKEDIEEARWEYVTILMLLKRWDNAKVELEKLVASDPSSVRYRIAMANVCMENGDVDKTIELYTQLQGDSLTEPEKKQVIEGMVKVYELSGQNEKALAHLAELVKMTPEDQELQLKLAKLYFAQGSIEKAREISVEQERKNPNNVEALSLLAKIEGVRQRHEVAATYWQKIIGLQPDSLLAHQSLYDYYLQNNNLAMSFKHLEQLIRISPDNISYLQQAAELNIQLDRLDRALEYYEFALAVDPTNEKIIQAKRSTQRMLAQDILALIENDTEKKVWQDLNKITPDSIGVYREAANLLREQHKVNELIEVLQLLHKHLPEDQQINNELSALQQKGMLNGQPDQQAEQVNDAGPDNNK